MSAEVPSESPFTELPEGTVTFLFTDIEGSTQLLSQLRDEYATLLSDQRRIMRAAFSRWQGWEVDTQGDAFFVAFARATQAVSAAVEIQRNLAEHDWPGGATVEVRMGLHTGEPIKAEEGYVGMDVHRAARIAHVGHGGQVLLSETAAALVRDELPQGVSLLDLGRHRLKDLPQPEHIRQLVIAGLPDEFPALKSLEQLPDIAWAVSEVRLPAFLEEGETEPTGQVFVARERELKQLEGYQVEALRGKGKVVFVTGDPGQGKTALLNAFAARAMGAHPELMAISGGGNAYSGAGDPYLPFREALSMLTGEVEARWASGSISYEHARRIWNACPLAAQSLVEHGPHLVEVFFSGVGLISRLSAAVPDQQVLLQSVRSMVNRQQEAPAELVQKSLFEEYMQVLGQVAASHPLLLLLDDLQWADAASINLLFHLGRRLESERILVVGAFRPEEVALGRGGERHPLESVLNELKRQHGETWIDLGEAPVAEGKQFVDGLLDSEPNHLGGGFREALHRHTGGHPLFTIELLRNLQERGDLVRDDGGHWVEGRALDWNVMPARVEGVIEQRIGRLEEELRELLAVASVEGEDFTAQVVGRVQELSERRLLHRLSAELEKRHRLVHTRGERRVGEVMLSSYQFTHGLFQQYLYNELSEGERRLLHKEIAGVLEELYGQNREAIYPQLAHHYSRADDGEKAVQYLLLAGDQARNAYAHQEAISDYRQALSFQEKMGDYEGAARTQMKLGQTYHSAFDYIRANEAYQGGFKLWKQISQTRSGVPLAAAPHALRLVIEEDPYSLDPAKPLDTTSGAVINLLFSGLVGRTPEMDVVPDLTERWEILEAGRRYVFYLRRDAHWSDGVQVTAGDFVYAWKRVLNPATGMEIAGLLYDIKGARAYHLGETLDVDSLGIHAIDGYTLEVELEAPSGIFLQVLTYPIAYPVPPHVVERWGANWTRVENLVVNGPFRLESWKFGESLSLVRNPEYHGRFGGNLERVEIDIIPDEKWAAQLRKYHSEELDILGITYIPPAERLRLQRLHVSEYLSAPGQNIFYFVFNTSRAPFDDVRVRRAFAMALGREGREPVSASLVPGIGGLIPPGIPGHSPEIGLPYNPDEARALMAQAGYPDGSGFPRVEILIWPSAERQLGNTLQRWQEVLGVEHTWDFAPMLGIPDRVKVQPPHLVFQGWAADYPDPDNFLRVGFRKSLSGWAGADFESLIELARRSQDQGERIQLYQRADKMLVEEAIVLPIAYGYRLMLVKPWVKNYPLFSSGEWNLNDVIIEPH